MKRWVVILLVMVAVQCRAATVTKSIGTSGRDYSTITLWEADLDKTNIYSAGDAAVGECYNDSAFNESVTINGGGTVGLVSVTLTVVAADRHDGTAGTGARIVKSTGGVTDILFASVALAKIRWLEVDANLQNVTYAVRGTAGADFYNLIVHGIRKTSSTTTSCFYPNDIAANCIAYHMENNTGQSNANSVMSASGSGCNIFNCVIFHCHGSSGVNRGLNYNGGSEYRNVYSGGNEGADWVINSGSGYANFSNNADEDGTISGKGANTLTGVIPANTFVSTVTGSEDLHLKPGAKLVHAGQDLGTTPTGVNIDIDGRDRDAENDTWDIGADQHIPSFRVYVDSDNAYIDGSNKLHGYDEYLP